MTRHELLERIARRTRPVGLREPFGARLSRRTRGSPLLGAIIGLVFALIGLLLTLDAIHFTKIAVPATATVIDTVQETTSDGDTVYAVTLRWRDHRGRTRVETPKGRASWYDFDHGAQVDILYDPDDPKDVRLADLASLWMLPLGFLVVGSIIATNCVMVLIYRLSNRLAGR